MFEELVLTSRFDHAGILPKVFADSFSFTRAVRVLPTTGPMLLWFAAKTNGVMMNLWDIVY